MAEIQKPENMWLIADQLNCLHCAYNLRGLAGPLVKCPECGGVNDLQDPAPWKVKVLPLGVREPQHWPAQSVVISFPMFVAAIVCFNMILEGYILAIIPAFILLLLLAAWIHNCKKWIKSCYSTLWALTEVTVLHVASWAIFVLLFVTGYYAEIHHTILNIFSITYIILIILSIYAILGIRRRIIRGSSTQKFRVDWQKWCLPVGNRFR